MAQAQTDNFEHHNRQAIRQILESVKGLRFGHLMITVHNGKIMQVDITEKKRFDDLSCHEKGSGI